MSRNSTETLWEFFERREEEIVALREELKNELGVLRRARAAAERVQDQMKAQAFLDAMQIVQPANLNEAESPADTTTNEAEQLPV